MISTDKSILIQQLDTALKRRYLTHYKPIFLKLTYYFNRPMERFKKRVKPSPLSMLLLSRAMSMS